MPGSSKGSDRPPGPPKIHTTQPTPIQELPEPAFPVGGSSNEQSRNQDDHHSTITSDQQQSHPWFQSAGQQQHGDDSDQSPGGGAVQNLPGSQGQPPESHADGPGGPHQQPNAPGDQGHFSGDTQVEGDARHSPTVKDSALDLGNENIDPIVTKSQQREHGDKLDDELAVLEMERKVSQQDEADDDGSHHEGGRTTRPGEPVDEFEEATNPLHEQQAAKLRVLETPTTRLAKFVRKVHASNWLVRYFVYITPVVVILVIPLAIILAVAPDAVIGRARLDWFFIWLIIIWLTLWLARIMTKALPWCVGMVASIFTSNTKKWSGIGKSLELPVTFFLEMLAIEISFLPTMKGHRAHGGRETDQWEHVVNRIIIALLVAMALLVAEKIIIQLIAVKFHMRTYSDRIEINRFQIGALTKLYTYSKESLGLSDNTFSEQSDDNNNEKKGFGKLPADYANRASGYAKKALNKVGDVAGAVAGDFTGKALQRSTHPRQVVLALLRTNAGSQILARRLYRTFVAPDNDVISPDDLRKGLDTSEEAEAVFSFFDRDMNGDISMEELEHCCVEIGRERKSITASLKDIDSVVGKLDHILLVIVVIFSIVILISIISTSAAGVLVSVGSAMLALSWLFSATAQELLQSIIFVFVKHPFDVGDRVTIYGTTGAKGTGDDYFVKEISLLYTEFKKMEGHVVQAPNSYLNTLFVLNQRRSGGLSEAVPIIIRFGTTLEQIEELRNRLLEFVRSEKRDYQPNVLTELREVTENYSITLNVVFFYRSSWQNELLRLQRRNKFFCHLMIALLDLGIDGPRLNMPGARMDLAWHSFTIPDQNLHGYDSNLRPWKKPQQETPPRSPTVPGQIEGKQSHSYSSGPPQTHSGSILRQPSRSSQSDRRTSHPSKHVDFSLGVNSLPDDDFDVTDVHQSRQRERLDDAIRRMNKEEKEKEEREKSEQEEREKEEAKQSDRPKSSGSDARQRSLSLASFRPGRGSTDSRDHRRPPGTSDSRNSGSTMNRSRSILNKFTPAFSRRPGSAHDASAGVREPDLEAGQARTSAQMSSRDKARQVYGVSQDKPEEEDPHEADETDKHKLEAEQGHTDEELKKLPVEERQRSVFRYPQHPPHSPDMFSSRSPHHGQHLSPTSVSPTVDPKTGEHRTLHFASPPDNRQRSGSSSQGPPPHRQSRDGNSTGSAAALQGQGHPGGSGQDARGSNAAETQAAARHEGGRENVASGSQQGKAQAYHTAGTAGDAADANAAAAPGQVHPTHGAGGQQAAQAGGDTARTAAMVGQAQQAATQGGSMSQLPGGAHGPAGAPGGGSTTMR
ncbi:hypothetical protein KEM52_002250 [Ascosphaera acerosa]|nr:hypothetical protein KEM52_002250 [Ascosphaera acerosa]